MCSATVVDYDQLQAALALAGLEVDAAEVHGVLCGSICNQMKTGASPDLQRLLTAGAQVDPAALKPLKDQLESLLQQTVRSLYGGEGDFSMLLPDEDEDIGRRVRSLADWGKGFVIGLLSNEAFAIDQLGDDAAEVARDMISISEMESDVEDDESEWDLAEVEEYVRVGVQVIFEDIQSAMKADSVSGELH